MTSEYDARPMGPSDMDAEVKSAGVAVRAFLDRLLPELAGWLTAEHQWSWPARSWEILLVSFLSDYLEAIWGRDPKFAVETRRPAVVEERWDALESVVDLSDLILDGQFDSRLNTAVAAPEARLVRGERESTIGSAKERVVFRMQSALAMWNSYLAPESRKAIKHAGRLFPKLAMPTAEYRSASIQADTRRDLVAQLQATMTLESEKERIAVANIGWCLPTGLLEDFPEYAKWATSVTKRFTAAMIANCYYAHARYPVLLAALHARGGRIIGSPHGIGYGMWQQIGVEYVERRICDDYLTWGWQDAHYATQAVCRPGLIVYSFNEVTLPGNTSRILWISNTPYPHPMRLYSGYLPVSGLESYSYRMEVLDTLSADLRQSLVLRPYFGSFGWPEEKMFRARFSDTDKSLSGREAICLSRLVVIDHCGTSILEALVSGVPTVCFWLRHHFTMRPTAEPAFQALRDAKILLHDLDEIAAHLSRIAANPNAWYGRDDVQAARHQFCSQFANTSVDVEAGATMIAKLAKTPIGAAI